MSEPSFFINMNKDIMEQFEEALDLAINTQQELTIREQPQSNRILIKALGQILTTLKTKLELIDGSTPK
tara:strand:+ start:545 stop:751 length:207 start_codon:yes stop_codon:yes gene_type:complete